MLSRTGIHALRAFAALAELPVGEFLGAAAIAERIGAPQNYLGKLLQQYARDRFVEGRKGFGGGFRLARPAADISLFEIVDPIEQLDRWDGCILGRETCTQDDSCPLHALLRRPRRLHRDAPHDDAGGPGQRRRGGAPPGGRGAARWVLSRGTDVPGIPFRRPGRPVSERERPISRSPGGSADGRRNTDCVVDSTPPRRRRTRSLVMRMRSLVLLLALALTVQGCSDGTAAAVVAERVADGVADGVVFGLDAAFHAWTVAACAERTAPRQVGLAALLGPPGGPSGASAFSEAFGQPSRAFGDELVAELHGRDHGYPGGFGSGGLGFRGSGPGGGGSGGLGRVHGLGRLDTGDGGSGGYGRSRGLGGLDTGGGRAQRGANGDAAKPLIRVIRGDLHAGQGCDSKDVAQVVRRRTGAIRACYEGGLRETPGLVGAITFEWAIQLDGTVADAAVAESTMESPAVERCALRVIRRMRFGEPDGEVCHVRCPFLFRSAD